MVKKGKVKQKKAQRASKSAAVKNRKQSEPSFSDVEATSSADEGTNKNTRCPHLKCIKMTKIKKIIPHLEPDCCYICRKEDVAEVEASIADQKEKKQFLCLTCCKVTCSTEDKDHAHEHFEMTNKGDSLTLNLKTLECWCFRCDSEVLPSNKNQVIFDVQTLVEKCLGSKASKAAEKSTTELRSSSKHKIRIVAPGLQNLGNTCFFNSLMQSIAATEYLQDMWMPYNGVQKTPYTFGPLNTSMRSMLTSMWTQRGSIVKPVEFFSMIAKKWKQFKGFHQQDSHELMRYLFDGLREEQIKANRKESNQGVDDPVRSYIDDCFGGKLVSLIVCNVCKSVSYSYEDFLDLSLPIDIEIKESMNKKSRKEKRSRKSLKEDADEEGIEGVEGTVRDDIEFSEADIPIPSSEYLSFVESLLSDRCVDMKIKKFSLENCFNKFTTVEELSGENSYTCESCYKYLHPKSEVEPSNFELSDLVEETSEENDGLLDSVLLDQEHESLTDSERQFENQTINEHQKHLELKCDDRESELLSLQEMTLEGSSESMMEMDLFDSSSSDDNDANSSPAVDSLGNYIEKHATVSPKKPEKPTYILRTAFRRYLIHTAPKVLVCHLKRFQQYELSMFRASTRKIDEYVQFPTEIDISAFMAPRTCFPQGKSPILSQNQELTIADFNDKKPQILYSLYAVVVHMGGLSGGHYVAYVLTDKYEEPTVSSPTKDPEVTSETSLPKAMGKRWIYCSDTQVRPAPLEEVLKCQAYLLFYQKHNAEGSSTAC